MADLGFMEKNMDILIDSLSGASGGVISSLIFHPLENLRTRLQARKETGAKRKEEKRDEEQGTTEEEHLVNEEEESAQLEKKLSALRFTLLLVKKEGLQSLYNGLGTSLFGVTISFGLYFCFYRVFKNIFLRRKKSLTDADIMLITFLAGSINTVLTHPIWMIQTRMCVGQKGSFLEHVRHIYREGGLK